MCVVEGVRVVGFDNERARVITATSMVKSVPTSAELEHQGIQKFIGSYDRLHAALGGREMPRAK